MKYIKKIRFFQKSPHTFLYREFFEPNNEDFESEKESEKKEKKEYNHESIHEKLENIHKAESTNDSERESKESELQYLYTKIEQDKEFEFVYADNTEELIQVLTAIESDEEHDITLEKYDIMCSILSEKYAQSGEIVRDISVEDSSSIRLVLQMNPEELKNGRKEESLVVLHDGTVRREFLESDAKTYTEGSEKGEDALYAGEDDTIFTV